MSNSEVNEFPSQLAPGDVLLIVPPVAPTRFPSYSVHLLQAGCRNAGITVNIFYANLHFANIISFDVYETIVESNSINFIGERLFARTAFDLPPMGRNIHHLIDPHWLPDHLWQKRNETASRKMSEYLNPIRRWALSVDWQHVENQAAQWIKSTAERIVRMGYRIVGCTNTLAGLLPGIALLNQVKQRDPNIITVLGGTLCEGEMAEGILSLKTGIDYVFSGESDITFPAFAQDVLSSKRPKEKIIYSKAVTNLDEIPVPDYREYFQQIKDFSLKNSSESRYPNTYLQLYSGNTLLYETSRGCSLGKCTFCGLNEDRKSFRVKSPGIVLDDLEQLVKQYPTSQILMTDNLMPQEYLLNLFPQISKAFPSIRILYEVNTQFTLDQVIALKQAGVTLIKPGIESLSQSLLKRIREGGTIRQNIALLRYARSIGIDVWWNLLSGIPGDQNYEYDEMLELIPLIRHLPPPVCLASLEIVRFSLYQTSPEEFEISNLRPSELYKDVLPTHADVKKLAYYFAADFKSQTYERPDILDRLRQEFNAWINTWKPYGGDSLNPQLPKLHLERKSPGEFVLHDTRGLSGTQEKVTVDREKAKILLVGRPWDDSPQLHWAVGTKLGVVRESWFISLATAEPEVLHEFEHNQE